MPTDTFAHKFLRILIEQNNLSTKSTLPDPYTNWSSAGEVLASKKYQDHLKNQWSNAEEVIPDNNNNDKEHV